MKVKGVTIFYHEQYLKIHVSVLIVMKERCSSYASSHNMELRKWKPDSFR
nr:hypothetical protein [Bacillus sp. FJAT-18017]